MHKYIEDRFYKKITNKGIPSGAPQTNHHVDENITICIENFAEKIDTVTKQNLGKSPDTET